MMNNVWVSGRFRQHEGRKLEILYPKFDLKSAEILKSHMLHLREIAWFQSFEHPSQSFYSVPAKMTTKSFRLVVKETQKTLWLIDCRWLVHPQKTKKDYEDQNKG